jgi:hypothetical protein
MSRAAIVLWIRDADEEEDDQNRFAEIIAAIKERFPEVHRGYITLRPETLGVLDRMYDGEIEPEVPYCGYPRFDMAQCGLLPGHSGGHGRWQVPPTPNHSS